MRIIKDHKIRIKKKYRVTAVIVAAALLCVKGLVSGMQADRIMKLMKAAISYREKKFLDISAVSLYSQK